MQSTDSIEFGRITSLYPAARIASGVHPSTVSLGLVRSTTRLKRQLNQKYSSPFAPYADQVRSCVVLPPAVTKRESCQRSQDQGKQRRATQDLDNWKRQAITASQTATRWTKHPFGPRGTELLHRNPVASLQRASAQLHQIYVNQVYKLLADTASIQSGSH